MNTDHSNTASADRDLVFVSHANPEDNSSALWLTSKLSLAGYHVWSDVTGLFGGEIIWDDIEEAIRNHTAKFIIMVSRNSQNANGVLDEVNLAVTVERNLGLSRFVIPIRLDDLPFDEFRANIARKNAVDFSQNWAVGLEQLLERLERDKVPKDTNHSPNLISTWFSERYSEPAKIQNKPQLLGSNWIPVTDIPQDIDFSRIPVAPLKANEMAKTFIFPSFAYQQFIGSFASSSELQPNLPSWLVLIQGHKVNTKDLINGASINFPSLTFQDGQNMVGGLLRKAWDNEMQRKGLLSYKFSDYTNAWFYPHGFVPKDTVSYTDLDGRARTKKLVGKSERLDSFWHFAVSANPHFGRLNRLSLKTHVVFTSDGINPLVSKEHMHAMRRSFCRNWYNEQWRGLVIAYLNHLSGNQQTISLPVSPSRHVVVSATPYGFKSPVSLEESEIYHEVMPDEEFDHGLSEDDDLHEFEDSGWERFQAEKPFDQDSEKDNAN